VAYELPDLAALQSARALVQQVARTTPVVPARWILPRERGAVHLKCENLQRAGSFKLRGAYVRIARLPQEVRMHGVVAASAGNHAQGVAVAARHLGIGATVFMPHGAALPKVSATLGYGARVELVGEIVDDAIAAALAHARESGATLVHPFDHEDVVLGQASVGLEILEQVPDVRTILVPTGGGGLLAGIAAAVRAVRGDRVRVIGVQAEAAAAWPASLSAGHPIVLQSMATMADGIAVARPGDVPFAIVERAGVEVWTVGEEAIARAMVGLMERSKQVVEPAGAPGVAALLDHAAGIEPPVVAVLSGGNIDPVLLQRLLRFGLAAAGRYLSVTVRLADSPGSLAALLRCLARVGANVLDIDHVWADPALTIGQVEVLVQVETRGPEHRAATLAALAAEGFSVRVPSR
jgi:threonine dehydratase